MILLYTLLLLLLHFAKQKVIEIPRKSFASLMASEREKRTNKKINVCIRLYYPWHDLRALLWLVGWSCQRLFAFNGLFYVLSVPPLLLLLLHQKDSQKTQLRKTMLPMKDIKEAEREREKREIVWLKSTNDKMQYSFIGCVGKTEYLVRIKKNAYRRRSTCDIQ